MKKAAFFLFIVLSIIHCNREPMVYEPTPQSINYGSLVYASNEVNCKNCHGIDYKGKGPDAKDLPIPVPDLTAELKPDKTPLSYFLAISVGTERTKQNGHNYHAYYYLTDAAKWGLAHFLYSLGKEPEDQETRKKLKEAYARAMEEAGKIYAENRKWYLGENTPSTERTKSPALQNVIQESGFQIPREVSINVPSQEKIEKVLKAREIHGEGYEIYKNNCQSCHGIAGEGVQGSQYIGLLDDSRYEPIRGVARRKPSFVGIPTLTPNSLTKEKINAPHGYSFTDDQWTQLIQYLKAITE